MGFGGCKVGQQRFRVLVIVRYRVRVLDVQIVAACLDVLGGDTPRLGSFLATFTLVAAPPSDAILEMLQSDRLRH